MYHTLVGLQGDGCERVSRDEEEEVAVRARQAVNRRESGQSLVAMGCHDTGDQDELPVALVTSDKSWTLSLSMEGFPDVADLQHWLQWIRKKGQRIVRPVEPSTSPLRQCGFGCHAQTSSSMDTRHMLSTLTPCLSFHL